MPTKEYVSLLVSKIKRCMCMHRLPLWVVAFQGCWEQPEALAALGVGAQGAVLGNTLSVF